MHVSIIKDTVQLDKEAREKIEGLKKEKELLEERLKEETIALQKAFVKENKAIILERKNAYFEEIKIRQENEKETYSKTLRNIQKQYASNKEKWIKDIYDACIKS